MFFTRRERRRKITKAFIRPVIPRHREDKNSGKRGVVFSIECGNRLSKEVWYWFSGGLVSDASDFILPVCLLPAMKNQTLLKIPGKVSPLLLQGVNNIQQIFSARDPKLSVLEIETNGAWQETKGPAQKVASFFSGGVDSAYTLLKHFDEIDTIIFVHGFDIPLANQTLRTKASEAIKTTAYRLGKELIEVETNLRDFSNLYVDWGRDYHGSALASIALLLAQQFKKFYIPATYTYENLFPRGSHPLLDPLWSTERTQIVHDGCEASRTEKIKLISKNDVIMKHLRVCWENRGGAYNCCKCEKCLRTMVSLAIIGSLEECPTFPQPLDLSLVAGMEINEHLKVFVEDNLKAAQQLNNNPALAQALRECLVGYLNA
jgi:hypothetical protein